jgi:hypothetical protein
MGHLPSRERASGSDRECAGDLQPPTVSGAVGVDGPVVEAAKRERADHVLDMSLRVGSGQAQSRAWPDVGATVVVSMPTVVDLPAPFGPRAPNTSSRSTADPTPRHRLNATGIGLRELVNSHLDAVDDLRGAHGHASDLLCTLGNAVAGLSSCRRTAAARMDRGERKKVASSSIGGSDLGQAAGQIERSASVGASSMAMR